MSEFRSVADKIYDVGIRRESFTPPGENEEVVYDRLVLRVNISGEPEELMFKGVTSDTITLVKAAEKAKDGDDGGFLDDDDPQSLKDAKAKQ